MLYIRDAVFNDKHSNDLQRVINIDEILSARELVFEKPSKATKALSPLRFAVTVRSEKTNLVLVRATEARNTVPYVVRMEEDNIEHTGYDLIHYESACAFKECIKYNKNTHSAIDEIMATSSVNQPMGLYYPNFSKGNPYFYSHIILKDEAVEKLTPYLAEGFRFIPIDDIDPVGNTPAFLNTIFNI